MSNINVKDLMLNRKSARDFDTTKKISDKDLQDILTATRMTPSAFNLMNLRLLVIDSESELKSQLIPLFYNQKNFINADKCILFVSDKSNKILNHTIDKTISSIFTKEQEEIAQKFRNNVVNSTTMLAKYNELDNWSKTTAHIASGVATVAAASLNIDSCIMGGFNANQLNEILIENNYLTSDEQVVLAMVLGYVNPNIIPKAKIRIDEKEFVTFVK
ncbi:NAD(P)H-dependent oxidoreductase [Mycoplasma yeatsii]|uniref:NAD(P)H-dependent oxidoreductase n=1 Tax=Mycoplasma yeatsii TaxID=51365 RepID=UPI0005B239E9|nr:NAD(P)H-dependent oxidoreductase [Mycoplasma yeatsii]AJM71690.1 nitroreductase family protein [Mycoplasma yeatsii GM274B]